MNEETYLRKICWSIQLARKKERSRREKKVIRARFYKLLRISMELDTEGKLGPIHCCSTSGSSFERSTPPACKWPSVTNWWSFINSQIGEVLTTWPSRIFREESLLSFRFKSELILEWIVINGPEKIIDLFYRVTSSSHRSVFKEEPISRVFTHL